MDLKIAIAGNPNSGKTTLFNALTGSNQFVGNWPGVTVEKKEGKLKRRDGITVTDLPGIYSLSPYTPEEIVARKYLIDDAPDAILNIVDGTNLERNLYLTTQLRELGIPLVICINMMDAVRKRGDKLDVSGLSRALGCPVVEISALRGEGLDEAVDAVIEAAKKKNCGGKKASQHIFSGTVEHALAHIEEAAIHDLRKETQRWYAIKIFERDARVIEKLGIDPEVISHIEADIAEVETELDDDAESIITNERYNYITRILGGIYKRKNNGLSATDRIDKIVTNKYLALPIFALIMFLVYFISVTTVGTWTTDFTNDGLFGEGWYFFGNFVPGIGVLLGDWLTYIGVAEWLVSLVVDGIVGGVGAVLGFVPQMLVLFMLLGFLEACGYMSRIAFIMDRIFRKFGLSGKSFIPILVGTGCGVPGIMASRTIENVRDRRITIITTTFIPCGAKLPVIALIAAAFFDNSPLVAVGAYFIGMAAIVISGIMLKKTKLFMGDPAPFVMELPPYHMPTIVNILRVMWERGWSFIKKAGTIILISSIVIWAGSTIGWSDGTFGWSADTPLETSILGYFATGVAWLFAPLGFGNVKATVATLMGLVAKEEVAAVFGVLGFGGMSALSAFSFLIFNLLCAPCFAAMGAIKREMNSARWTAFAISYQCGFAYAVSLVIYQLGMLFTGNYGWHIAGGVVAILIICAVLYMLIRTPKGSADFKSDLKKSAPEYSKKG